MAAVTLEQLENASLDANSLAEFVNGTALETVLTRLGVSYPTLAALAALADVTAPRAAIEVTSFPYTLVADDNGEKFKFISEVDVIVNVGVTVLAGQEIRWRTIGAGRVTFVGIDGMDNTTRSGASYSIGNGSEGGLIIWNNTGSVGEFTIDGDVL